MVKPDRHRHFSWASRAHTTLILARRAAPRLRRFDRGSGPMFRVCRPAYLRIELLGIVNRRDESAGRLAAAGGEPATPAPAPTSARPVNFVCALLSTLPNGLRSGPAVDVFSTALIRSGSIAASERASFRFVIRPRWRGAHPVDTLRISFGADGSGQFESIGADFPYFLPEGVGLANKRRERGPSGDAGCDLSTWAPSLASRSRVNFVCMLLRNWPNVLRNGPLNNFSMAIFPI